VPPEKAPDTNDDTDEVRASLCRLAEAPGFGGLCNVTIAQRKPARYLDLLGQFFEQHADDGQRLHACIEAGTAASLADARRLAHTLKGVAATFGLTDLLRIAEEVQQQLTGQAEETGETGESAEWEAMAGIGKAAFVASADRLHASLQQLQTSAREILEAKKKP
jgi:HPt (histidine-containing phosphotransfer) domain-containing protein